jgi:hypothetical protein
MYVKVEFGLRPCGSVLYYVVYFQLIKVCWRHKRKYSRCRYPADMRRLRQKERAATDSDHVRPTGHPKEVLTPLPTEEDSSRHRILNWFKEAPGHG